MAPGTEFARDFCAGIGPLQFGVVLVYCAFSKFVLQCFDPLFGFMHIPRTPPYTIVLWVK